METLYYLVREKTTNEPIAVGSVSEFATDTQSKFHTNILVLKTQWCERITLPEYETCRVFDLLPVHNQREIPNPPVVTWGMLQATQRWCLICNPNYCFLPGGKIPATS